MYFLLEEWFDPISQNEENIYQFTKSILLISIGHYYHVNYTGN